MNRKRRRKRQEQNLKGEEYDREKWEETRKRREKDIKITE